MGRQLLLMAKRSVGPHSEAELRAMAQRVGLVDFDFDDVPSLPRGTRLRSTDT